MLPKEMLLHCLIIIKCILVTQEDDVTAEINEIGYPAEVHTITTEDLYILGIHRIPQSKPTSKTAILVHGLLGYSAQFLASGPGIPKALAFKLADNGYDVWLANMRGTDFSRNHKNLSPNSEKYWNFSLDEISKYDLPAIIDYILMKTNNTALHYVGHSQGTTLIMAMLCTLPQYNKKLKTVHLMTPSVYFKNAEPYMKTALMFSEPLEDALGAVGLVEFPSLPLVLRKLVVNLCSSKSATELCKQVYHTIVGPSMYTNEAIFTELFLTKVMRFLPSTASIMQMLHYAQLIRSGGEKFLHFDHKKENNLLMYNQSTPPEYKLSNVKTKIHFLYGTVDYIINYQDVEQLIKELKPCVIGISKIIGYNHADFVIGKHLNKFVNTKILNLMNRYN